ncbi:MAG: VOC family protein [Sphingomicrobium sp.]
MADIDRAVSFYVDGLGFAEAWRHSEGGKALVAQVERDGSEYLLSCQWPDKTGSGLIFVSLDPGDVAETRGRLERAGITVREGWWGYPLIVECHARTAKRRRASISGRP